VIASKPCETRSLGRFTDKKTPQHRTCTHSSSRYGPIWNTNRRSDIISKSSYNQGLPPRLRYRPGVDNPEHAVDILQAQHGLVLDPRLLLPHGHGLYLPLAVANTTFVLNLQGNNRSVVLTLPVAQSRKALAQRVCLALAFTPAACPLEEVMMKVDRALEGVTPSVGIPPLAMSLDLDLEDFPAPPAGACDCLHTPFPL
jgi:hypothetical protein